MKKYLVLNGPNINLVGLREPEVYGSYTLAQIQEHTQKKLASYELELEWFQSNVEGELIDRIHKFIQEDFNALIINLGGFSHTSIAIHDALKVVKRPIIETHLTNVYKREEFRQTMLTAKAASKIMCGLGKDAYFLAILSDYLI